MAACLLIDSRRAALDNGAATTLIPSTCVASFTSVVKAAHTREAKGAQFMHREQGSGMRKSLMIFM